MSGFDNEVMYANNWDFRGVQPVIAQVSVAGQLPIGTGASPAILVGTITSPSGTVTIGYSSPNITVDVTGGLQPIEKFTVDTTTGGGTNPVVPTGTGLITITAGQYPSGTFGTRVMAVVSQAANQYAVLSQISSAVSASDPTKNGFAHFNSTQFSVDATTGFVSTIAAFSRIVNQVFTSNGTYTPTSGMKYCVIDAVGGGGAGGGGAANAGTQLSGGGGGGAGGYSRGVFSAATIGASQSVGIGAGGTGVSGASGNNGSNTTVGSLITANGGTGATSVQTTGLAGASGVGGSGGSGSGGAFSSTGMSGVNCFMTNVSVTGAIGGSSYFGGGAQGVAVNGALQSVNGNNANNYGGGGSGSGATGNAGPSTGGNGSSGIVVITEYI